ncbi:MAG: hypothetical protein Q8Q67_01075 [bacterium]|nr:hypothetical protein [bacterium]
MSRLKQFYCSQCKEKFESKAKYNLAGFRTAKCPKCKNATLLPLGKGYKTTYWILVVLILAIFLVNLVDGIFKVTVVGLALVVMGIYSLIKDKQIRKDKGII